MAKGGIVAKMGCSLDMICMYVCMYVCMVYQAYSGRGGGEF